MLPWQPLIIPAALSPQHTLPAVPALRLLLSPPLPLFSALLLFSLLAKLVPSAICFYVRETDLSGCLPAAHIIILPL